jgi:homospermidine synthase
MTALERFRLADRADDLAGELSHGEQQWLEIAMALAPRPKLLLLDEPTGGMSPEERRVTGELLQPIRAHCALVIVEHDLDFIKDICDHLTVWEGDRPAYRPTVHYAYCPSDAAIASMHELEMRRWDLQPVQRILNDEITDGEDRLGVLLLGHPLKGWWTGSLLSVHEARSLVPHQNATTLQVAASVLAATVWMIERPDEGVRVPDELPWERILEVARPYLGPISSDAVDWDPIATRDGLFDRWNGRAWDLDDPWQFTNFLV